MRRAAERYGTLPDDKLDAFVASEYESWTKLIREAGIKLD